jgi:hypothetical protein
MTRKTRHFTAASMEIVAVRAGAAHLLKAREDSLFLEPSMKHGTTVDYQPQRMQVLEFLKSSK